MTNLPLPLKVIVTAVKEHRYHNKPELKVAPGSKPLNWDLRLAGEDVVSTTFRVSEAENALVSREIKLKSMGDQAVPAPGWTLMLSEGNESEGYHWTLYGFDRDSTTLSVS